MGNDYRLIEELNRVRLALNRKYDLYEEAIRRDTHYGRFGQIPLAALPDWYPSREAFARVQREFDEGLTKLMEEYAFTAKCPPYGSRYLRSYRNGELFRELCDLSGIRPDVFVRMATPEGNAQFKKLELLSENKKKEVKKTEVEDEWLFFRAVFTKRGWNSLTGPPLGSLLLCPEDFEGDAPDWFVHPEEALRRGCLYEMVRLFVIAVLGRRSAATASEDPENPKTHRSEVGWTRCEYPSCRGWFYYDRSKKRKYCCDRCRDRHHYELDRDHRQKEGKRWAATEAYDAIAHRKWDCAKRAIRTAGFQPVPREWRALDRSTKNKIAGEATRDLQRRLRDARKARRSRQGRKPTLKREVTVNFITGWLNRLEERKEAKDGRK